MFAVTSILSLTASNIQAQEPVTPSTPAPDQRVPALLEQLINKNPEIQKNAISILTQLQDPRAVSALIDALKNSENSEDVRQVIVNALGQFSDPARVVPALVEVSSKDSSTKVRAEALFSLKRFEHPAVVPAFLAALKDSDAGVCMAAVGGLQQRGSNGIIPALLETLYHPHPGVRQAVLTAFGHFKDPIIIPALARASDPAHESNAEIRIAALTARGRMGDMTVIDPLKEALNFGSQWKENDLKVRVSAKNALLQLIPQLTSHEALQSLLAAWHTDVQSATIKRLGEILNKLRQ